MKTKSKFKEYKLYIWYDIRTDYTDGIGFAVARNLREAKNAIKETCLKNEDRKWEWDFYADELKKKPEVRKVPSGDWISGGG